MLYKIDTNEDNSISFKIESNSQLASFKIKETSFQKALFENDYLLNNTKFIKLMQSTVGREEPDIMALSEDGTLYIFELKRCQAKEENLLQVLRYGQRYGRYTIDELDSVYRQNNENRSLREAYQETFEADIDKIKVNYKQVFVVVTNGIDTQTLSAIKYWSSLGISIEPWVYNIYSMDGEPKLEMMSFKGDNEDFIIEGQGGFYILNTNTKHGKDYQDDMLSKEKASTYTYPWTEEIKKVRAGDTIFLYQNGAGIIAKGIVKKEAETCYLNEELEAFVKLEKFKSFIETPISAAKIKLLIERNIVLQKTMCRLDSESGELINQFIKDTIQ